MYSEQEETNLPGRDLAGDTGVVTILWILLTWKDKEMDFVSYLLRGVIANPKNEASEQGRDSASGTRKYKSLFSLQHVLLLAKHPPL